MVPLVTHFGDVHDVQQHDVAIFVVVVVVVVQRLPPK